MSTNPVHDLAGDDEPSPGTNRIVSPIIFVAIGIAIVISVLIIAFGAVGLSKNNDNIASADIEEAITTNTSVALPPPSKASHVSTTSADTSTLPRSSHAAIAPSSARPHDEGPTPGEASPQQQQDNTRTTNTTTDEQQRSAHKTSNESAPSPHSDEHWDPSTPLPADYVVTSKNPTIEELNGIVHFLTATDASDSAKTRNIEAPDAVVVPKTVSRIGLFRAPRGGSTVSGPIKRDGNRITVHLDAHSAGIPTVSMPITFVYKDGNWRLASSSMCAGVRTLGLPIYCNA